MLVYLCTACSQFCLHAVIIFCMFKYHFAIHEDNIKKLNSKKGKVYYIKIHGM